MSLALLITVFAFDLVGDGLRDVLDPRSQRSLDTTPLTFVRVVGSG